MKRFSKFITDYPWMVLLFVVGITFYMGMGIPKIITQNNHDSELPDSDPIVKSIDNLKSVFGNKKVVLIGIESNNIFTSDCLKKIDQIANEVKEIDGVIGDEVTCLTNINNIEGKEWGLAVGPFIKKIPTDNKELAELKKAVANNTLLNKRLVSEDGTFTVIIANLEDEYIQTDVANKVADIAKKYQNPETFYLAGDPIQEEEIDKGIQSDIGLLMPLAFLFIIIGYFVAFRSAKGVFLPTIVIILSLIWTMGFMGHFGFTMNVVTSTIPLIMIAVASSYPLHIVARYYEERINNPKREAVFISTHKVLQAVLMAGVTSALGMITLLTFQLASIRDLGVIGASGIILTIFITVTFIPSMLCILKSKEIKKMKEARIDALGSALSRLGVFSVKHRVLVLFASFLIVLISFWGISKVVVGNDFIESFPQKHVLRVAFNKFNTKLGGASYLDIMIDGNKEDAIKDPILLSKIVEFQNYAEQLDGVGYSSSFANIIMRMNKEMHNGDIAYEKIPDSQNLIAQYLLLYSMSGNPADFSNLVDYNYQRAKIRIMLQTSEQVAQKEIYKKLNAYAQTHFTKDVQVEYGGDVMFWLAQVSYIVMGKIQNIVGAILIVFIFCLIWFRSLRGGLISIVPLTISSLLTFGLMGFMGIRLDIGTAIITSIGVGVGVDYAIHYILRYREEIRAGNSIDVSIRNTMVTTGSSIVYDTLSNVCSFMPFVISGFVPLQNFGWLISFTMITVAFGTLIFLPPLFSYLVKPNFLNRNMMDKNINQLSKQDQSYKVEPKAVKELEYAD